MTIEISLTKGYVAIVDDEDADLALLKWHAGVHRQGKYVYAIRISKERERISIHRLVLSRIVNRLLESHEFADHIDGNCLNNCRANLRIATHTQNQWNRAAGEDSKTGLKGVYWDNGREKWRSRIYVDNKRYMLGRFDTPLEAHKAWCRAAVKHHKEFANFGANSPFKPEDFKQHER